MYKERNETNSPLSSVPAMGSVNRDHWPLIDIVRGFARPMRGRPTHLILDGFDHEFFLMFNFEEDPETPASKGTCDIELVQLPADDFLAESVRLVANANKFGVMRMLAALGLERFDDKVKTAFYQSSNPLRTMKDEASPAD